MSEKLVKLKNRGLSNDDLWQIAGLIAARQKESKVISEERKSLVNWLEIEGEWFDWLEEELNK
jgi:uncharacterized membrane protein YvbJ